MCDNQSHCAWKERDHEPCRNIDTIITYGRNDFVQRYVFK